MTEETNETASPPDQIEDNETGDLTTVQVIGSTLAAFFGVQSKKNKVRDFERGKPHQFIAAGALFTLLFLIGMIALVNVIT